MSRHPLILTKTNRRLACEGVAKAPDGWVLELREPTRSNEQNAALWSLLNQVQRQRPTHNGVKMTPELWKATFMHALGVEGVFLPALDGGGLFPAGFRSSQLGKHDFAALLELILAWCAREGLAVQHFDEPVSSTQGGRQPNKLAAEVAA